MPTQIQDEKPIGNNLQDTSSNLQTFMYDRKPEKKPVINKIEALHWVKSFSLFASIITTSYSEKGIRNIYAKNVLSNYKKDKTELDFIKKMLEQITINIRANSRLLSDGYYERECSYGMLYVFFVDKYGLKSAEEMVEALNKHIETKAGNLIKFRKF